MHRILFSLFPVFFILILMVLPATGENNTGPAVPPGSPDTSFHPPDGFFTHLTTSPGQEQGNGIARTGDGGYLIAGSSKEGSQHILLLSYDAEGRPDKAFGKNGSAIYRGTGGETGATAIVVQKNSRILLTGYEGSPTDQDLLVIRYNRDGTPDSSFGKNGSIRYSGEAKGRNSGEDIAVLPDDSIIVTGESYNGVDTDLIVMKFDPDGEPISSFGSGGIFRYDSRKGDDSGAGIAVTPGGKIALTGGSSEPGRSALLVMRLNPDGTPDQTFGDDGMVITQGKAGGPDSGRGITLTPDGKVVAAGFETEEGESTDIRILQLTEDGRFDTGFGINGTVRFGTAGVNDHAGRIITLGSGSILATGSIGYGGKENPALFRMNDYGMPDKSFGVNGVSIYPQIGAGLLNSVIEENDGRLLATGTVSQEDTRRIAMIRVIG